MSQQLTEHVIIEMHRFIIPKNIGPIGQGVHNAVYLLLYSEGWTCRKWNRVYDSEGSKFMKSNKAHIFENEIGFVIS